MKTGHVLALIVFCVVAYVVSMAVLPAVNKVNKTSQQAQIQTAISANGTPVTGKPSLTASYVDHVLCSASSPACGDGSIFYQDSLSYNIDDAYALAFFQHESAFGLKGVARVNKGIGNIRCQGWQGACLSGYRAYSTWQQGIDDWYQLIAWYVSTLHKSTVETILPTYAPPSDSNDDSTYIASVEGSVTYWRKAAQP